MRRPLPAFLTLGARLQHWRWRYHVTLEAVARWIERTSTSVRQWELGQLRPSRSIARELERLLARPAPEALRSRGRRPAGRCPAVPPPVVPPTAAELRAWRRRLGVTESELAELAGVTVAAVRQWEAGTKRVAWRRARTLRRILARRRPRGRRPPPEEPVTPDQLRAWRAKYGVTRARLAALVRASVPAVQTWESGLRRPRLSTERRLRVVLVGPPRGWRPPLPPPPPEPVVPPLRPADLRRWRRRGRVSVKKLARALRVTIVTVYRWESGEARPRRDVRAQLLALLAREAPEALRATRGRAKPRRWEGVDPRQIVEWRRRRGVSRKSLACLLGVSETAVGLWEQGKTVPGPALQRRVEAALRGRSVPSAPPRVLGAPPIPGAAITAWRQQRGWPRRRLAEALGVSEATVAGWEHGRTRPRGASEARLRLVLEGGPAPEEEAPRWELVSARELRALVRSRGPRAVARALGTDTDSVRAWETGGRAPPLALQRLVAELVRGDGSAGAPPRA